MKNPSTMIVDESYSVLYLYNAVIEYIYFLIILIQDRGPNNLSNVAKHLKFFKKDVYTFIQIFKGSTFAEKLSQMLLSTTSVFEIKDNTLHLANNHKSFVKIIYEDLLISKVVDLILRGIFTVQDICHNLNLSSIINIKEDYLITLLKHNPHIYFNSNSSVMLVQFHGLVGFENHTYHTTVQYFQSYLQNVNLLTYNDIKLHRRFVPSCAIQNDLIIFCILHVSILFKCKDDKVSLRNKFKKTHRNQVLNVEKVATRLSSNSWTIGMLVLEIHGPTIISWKGEISNLMSNAGLIQCVVNFTNGHQGIFVIYFYKTALKYVCEVGNVRHFLNICDVVEFDAEYCGETNRKDVVWQATRIKVIEHVFKESEHKNKPDTDKYMENINLNYHKLKPVVKDCIEKRCLAKYTILEKDTSTETKCSIPEKDTSNHNESFEELNSSDVEERKTSNISCQKSVESQEQEVVTLINSSKILDSCCVHCDKPELDNNQLSNTNHFDNTINISNQMKTSEFQYPPINNLEEQKVHNKLKDTSNGYVKHSIISKQINGILLKNCVTKNIEQNLVNNHPDGMSSGTLPNVKCQSINSITHSILMPNIFNDSSFILGEITFMSTHNGVAQSLHKNKPHEIFFEKNNISFLNGATKVLAKGNQVLLFIPYANLEDSVLIATLVYPLTCEEKIVIQEKDLDAKDFVVNNFFQKVEKSFTETFCFCDLLKSLSAYTHPDQNLKYRSENLLQCSQFREHLRELFQFNDRTYRNLFSLVSYVCAQNLGINYKKLLNKPSFTFLRSLLWMSHSKNFSLKYTHGKKNMNRYKSSVKQYKPLTRLQKEDCNDDTISANFNKKIPIILSNASSVDDTYLADNDSNIVKLNELDKKSATENSVINQSRLETACDGKSSVSSFSSCLDDSIHESSDDVFYSCESDSDSSPVFCKQPRSENNNNLCETAETPNSSIALNKFCNIVPNNTLTCLDKRELNEIEFSRTEDKRILNYGDACSYLKMRNFLLFKHRRKKQKIIIPSRNVFCKSCHQPPIEITGEISILCESTLYFRPKCYRQNVTLAFPINLIPVEKIEKMKLNASIKATIIPHLLMNFSRVLYIDFI